MNPAGIQNRSPQRPSGQTRQFVRMAIAVVCLYPAIGQAADMAQPLADLFDIGWKASEADSTALKLQYYGKAQESYKKAKADATGDPRVDYAMAIVAAQNGRLPEAAKYLEEAPRPYEPPLFMRRLHVWLQINRGDSGGAQAAAAALAQTVGADTSVKHTEEKQEIANWLGRVLGYYSGPAKNPLKAENLAKLDAELSATMTGPLATACSEGQAAAAERYTDLQGQLEAAQQAAKEKIEKDRIDTQNKLAADIEAGTQRKNDAELAAQQMQVVWDTDNEILKSQYAQRQIEYNNVGSRLSSLKNDRESEQNKDPKKQDTAKISNLDDQISSEEHRVESRQRELLVQIRNINASAVANNSKLARARQQLTDRTNELNELQNKKSKLDAAAKRLAAQTKVPISNPDNTTKRLDGELKSIKTYAPIDLAKERQRIMDSFHKQQDSITKK